MNDPVRSAEVKVAGESLAAAWRAWLDSPDGKQCRSPLTGDRQEVFLENRLWWAFMAGAKAAEEAATKE